MKRIFILIFFSCILNSIFGQAISYYLFKWQWEPNEKAFKILLPERWITEGGIFRIDPTAGGGAANALEAKLDFTIKSDNAESQ